MKGEDWRTLLKEFGFPDCNNYNKNIKIFITEEANPIVT